MGERTVADDDPRSIFIHGLVSSGQGFKGRLLRRHFPDILTPDFAGPLAERMAQLRSILGDKAGWLIVGSSFGGLMGAVFTCRHPQQVQKLVLLAPALTWPDFYDDPPPAVSVPTVVYHGRWDEVIPLDAVCALAQRTFTNLTFHAVDDDHRLHKTVQQIDWPALLAD